MRRCSSPHRPAASTPSPCARRKIPGLRRRLRHGVGEGRHRGRRRHRMFGRRQGQRRRRKGAPACSSSTPHRPAAARPGCSPPGTTGAQDAGRGDRLIPTRHCVAQMRRSGSAWTADDMKTARNILAQTKTGDTKNVVMVGAHLDSTPEPGHQRQRHGGGGPAGDRDRAGRCPGSPTRCGSRSGDRGVGCRVRRNMCGGWRRAARRHRHVSRL